MPWRPAASDKLARRGCSEGGWCTLHTAQPATPAADHAAAATGGWSCEGLPLPLPAHVPAHCWRLRRGC